MLVNLFCTFKNFYKIVLFLAFHIFEKNNQSWFKLCNSLKRGRAIRQKPETNNTQLCKVNEHRVR